MAARKDSVVNMVEPPPGDEADGDDTLKIMPAAPHDVKSTDMEPDAQEHAVQQCNIAIQTANFQVGRDSSKAQKKFCIAAEMVKKSIDTKFGGTWHVVIGTNFGTQVIHQEKCFIYFYMDGIGYCIWKAGF